MPRHLGQLGTPVEQVEASFDYFDTTIRINPDFGMLDVIDFMESVETVDTESLSAMRVVKDLLRQVVHTEDFERFWALSKQQRQGLDEVMKVAFEAIEAVTERPTQRPSDSSGGPVSIVQSSTVDSYSPVKADLESQGRPDLARVVAIAQQARTA